MPEDIDFDELSWVALGDEDIDAMQEALDHEPVRTVKLSFASGGDSLASICRPGCEHLAVVRSPGATFVFGYQAGLGGIAASLSQSLGPVVSIENDQDQGVVICGLYQEGEAVRKASEFQADFSQTGEPIPGEPSLKPDRNGLVLTTDIVLGLAAAWGPDPRLLAEGAEVTILERRARTPEKSGSPWTLLGILLGLALLVYLFTALT